MDSRFSNLDMNNTESFITMFWYYLLSLHNIVRFSKLIYSGESVSYALLNIEPIFGIWKIQMCITLSDIVKFIHDCISAKSNSFLVDTQDQDLYIEFFIRPHLVSAILHPCIINAKKYKNKDLWILMEYSLGNKHNLLCLW